MLPITASDSIYAMSENPLVKALPPETDYLSYLTILEYNLSLEQLPTLHEILQDTTLTSNIGWDLVHLLLPLLPASKLCLQDVARLGNPREVVLKVTELLEELRVQDEQVQSEGVANGVIKTYGSGQVLDALGADVDPRNVQEEQQDDRRNEEGLHYPPSKALRFCVLLEMLAVLHPRIKTKYPSRFLSTSLQAILPAYAQLADSTDAFEAVVGLMKELSGSRRPRLPPRKASSHIPISEDGKPQSAPDPEAQSEAMTSEEIKLQLRLLQSFLTYVIEAYMSALSSNEDVVGMEWSSRLQEKLHPEKVVPGHAKLTERFANNEKLHALDTSLGQMLVRQLRLPGDPAANFKARHLRKTFSSHLPNSCRPSHCLGRKVKRKSQISLPQPRMSPCRTQAACISSLPISPPNSSSTPPNLSHLSPSILSSLH